MKGIKSVIKKSPKRSIAFLIIFTMLLSYIAPIINVVANSYGDGDNFINMDITNDIGFTINNVTVNGDEWTNHEDEFHSTNNQYHIEINVSGNEITGEKVPRIQYGGNWNDYITSSTQHNENNYTFVLDVDDSDHQGFLGLSLEEQFNEPNNQNPEPGPHFDGKAYLIWSCGEGVCYHYFDNIPSFEDGRSTFYKDTDIAADNNNTITFDIKAKFKDWILKEDFEHWVNAYKQKYNVNEIDWNSVNPEDIIGNPPDMREWEEQAINAGACTKQNTPQDDFERCVDGYMAEHSDSLPFVKLQPLGEPSDNNAYVSYGDRNFKVVIYNSDFKGVTMGDLSELNYYPSSWSNPFIMRDQFDISGTTKNNPTVIDSILLESTVVIKSLNYNSFAIESMEALDVPEGAVTITKVNGEFKLVFSSNFYDNVVFKVTDTNGGVSYLQIKRYTIDGWIRFENNHPVLTADFYFDRNRSYDDFDITAKIVYKDGTTKNVDLKAVLGIDDGLGNITEAYEVDEQSFGGKGLKKSTFEYALKNGEDKTIEKVYLNAEYKGSTASNYAGAYVGSGKGVLANIYQGEEE